MEKTLTALLLSFCIASCLQPLDDSVLQPHILLENFLSSTSNGSPTTPGFSIGGTISGDTPLGLRLDFSGVGCGAGQTLHPTTTGNYAFPGIPDGCSMGSIAIASQPASGFCKIYNNTGLNIVSASVTNVNIYCFSVELPGGPLTVYEGTPLKIQIRLTNSPGPSGATAAFSSNNPAITVTPSRTFTSLNYNTYQDVILLNPIDGNLTSEVASISASADGQTTGSLAVNSHDSTPGSIHRFIYITSSTHNGNFAGDIGLAGNNWMEKADSFCSQTAGMPAPIAGTGNYRAVLTDGILRSGTVGAQANWPLRSGAVYYGYDSLLFQAADASNTFPIPVTNLLTGGGNYWTGLVSAVTWASTYHCNSWSDGTIGSTGSSAIATFNNASLVTLSTLTCDQTRNLLCVQDLRDRGDGTISSAYQNLIWQKCEGGQDWTGACTGTVTAMSYCNLADDSCNGGNPVGTLTATPSSPIYIYCSTMTLAGRSWRVPTTAELQELYRATRTDASLFPGLSTTNYYHSNRSVSTTQANGVLFSGGTVGTLNKTLPLRIRCVSDGM